MGEVIDETASKACPICAEKISALAKRCIKCHSDLTWKRYLPLGSTSLALATALVAVLGQTSASIYKIISPRDAKTSLEVFNAVPYRGLIRSGELSPGYVNVLAANAGQSLGMLNVGRISMSWSGPKEDMTVYATLLPEGLESLPIGAQTTTLIKYWRTGPVYLSLGTTEQDADEILSHSQFEDDELLAPCTFSSWTTRAPARDERHTSTVPCTKVVSIFAPRALGARYKSTDFR